MKKKSLISLLLVVAVLGTLLVGCGGNADASVNTPVADNSAVENQQEEVTNQESEVVVSTEEVVSTETAEIPNGEDLPLTVPDETEATVDDGTFYGLEIVPSGEQVTRAWHREQPDGEYWMGGVSELPITATVDVTTNADGKLVKTVTYAMQGGASMAGDWTVNIFDFNTGADLEAAGYEISASEATRSEDENTAYWSATIVYDETVEPIFLWTQVTTNYNVCSRNTDTNIAEYIADMNKDLANYTDLLAYEFSFWFLATK